MLLSSSENSQYVDLNDYEFQQPLILFFKNRSSIFKLNETFLEVEVLR